MRNKSIKGQAHTPSKEIENNPSLDSAEICLILLRTPAHAYKEARDKIVAQGLASKMQIAGVRAVLTGSATRILEKFALVNCLEPDDVLDIHRKLSEVDSDRKRARLIRGLTAKYDLSAKLVVQIAEALSKEVTPTAKNGDQIPKAKLQEPKFVVAGASQAVCPHDFCEKPPPSQATINSLDSASCSLPELDATHRAVSNRAADIDYDKQVRHHWHDRFGVFLDRHFNSNEYRKLHVLALLGRNVYNEGRLYLDRGIPPQQIITVENDRDAYEEAKREADKIGIQCIYGDLQEVVQDLHIPFSIVSYDFTGPLCDKYCDILQHTLLAERAVVRTNVQRAREGADAQNLLLARHQMIQSWNGNSDLRNTFDPIKYREHLQKSGSFLEKASLSNTRKGMDWALLYPTGWQNEFSLLKGAFKQYETSDTPKGHFRSTEFKINWFQTVVAPLAELITSRLSQYFEEIATVGIYCLVCDGVCQHARICDLELLEYQSAASSRQTFYSNFAAFKLPRQLYYDCQQTTRFFLKVAELAIAAYPSSSSLCSLTVNFLPGRTPKQAKRARPLTPSSTPEEIRNSRVRVEVYKDGAAFGSSELSVDALIRDYHRYSDWHFNNPQLNLLSSAATRDRIVVSDISES